VLLISESILDLALRSGGIGVNPRPQLTCHAGVAATLRLTPVGYFSLTPDARLC